MTTPAKYHAPDSYYELKQLLGQGNFAEVWRAADKLGQRKMAVKLYKKRSMKHDHIQMLVKQEVEYVVWFPRWYYCFLLPYHNRGSDRGRCGCRGSMRFGASFGVTVS